MVGAVIVAAGAGRRFGGDKVFADLLGRPVLAWTVAAFESTPEVDIIVVVLSPENLGRGQALAQAHGWRKVRHLCPGGPRRQDSVRAGLAALSGTEWVVVHDGVRPCVTPQIIRAGLAAARQTGAAIAALPVIETLKRVDAQGRVLATVPRAGLWTAQTPQVFRTALLVRAHREVTAEVTDDSAMVEALGHPVVVYPGSPANIKITIEEDLALAAAILGGRAPVSACG